MTKFLAFEDAAFSVITHDGEAVATLPVKAGVHSVEALLADFPAGYSLDPLKGLVELPQRNWGAPTAHPERAQSGANPSWQPTSATTAELQMRAMLRDFQATARHLTARIRAAEKIDAIPAAPAPAEDVVENIDAE